MKNKKIFTVLFFLTINLSADLLNGIGIKSGVSISKLKFKFFKFEDLNFNTRYRTGLYESIFIETFRKKYLCHDFSIYYKQNGGRDDALDYFNNTPIKLNYRLDYIGVNYSFKVFPNSNRIIPFLSIGPFFEFLIYNSDEFDAFDEKLKNHNFGLVYNIGAEYRFSKFSVIFDFILNHNFKSFYENSYVKHTMNSINFSIGIKYNINKTQ